MKTIIMIVAMGLLGASMTTLAETKVGLGASVNTLISYNNTDTYASTGNIFFPIRINNKLLLEPYLIYQKYEEDGESGSYSLRNNESNGLGFGAFYIIDLRESMHTYFGGKLSWYDSTTTYKYQDSDDDKYEYERYWIAPLVGLEYQTHKNVFLAIETGIGYSDIQTKQTSRLSDPKDSDGSSVNTFTNLMIRMMF